jgi:hypothetical protein
MSTDLLLDHAPVFDILDGMLPLIAALESLSTRYYLAGEVGNCSYGVVRDPLTIELVADVHVNVIAPLLTLVQPDYAVDADEIAQALLNAGTCFFVHLTTFATIELRCVGNNPQHQAALGRAAPLVVDLASGRTVRMATPEDLILELLTRVGPTLPQRGSMAWYDLQGLLKVQADSLDLAYLRRQATALGLTDALHFALQMAVAEPLSLDTTLEQEQRELVRLRRYSPTERFTLGRESVRAAVQFLCFRARQLDPTRDDGLQAALYCLRWRLWSPDHPEIGVRLAERAAAHYQVAGGWHAG